MEYRGLPLDLIENLLPLSPAYRQAASGMLDGIFGAGEGRHIAVWQAVKVVDRSEEVEEDGTVIRRERERFTNELTLLYASGETAILHWRGGGWLYRTIGCLRSTSQ